MNIKQSRAELLQKSKYTAINKANNNTANMRIDVQMKRRADGQTPEALQWIGLPAANNGEWRSSPFR